MKKTGFYIIRDEFFKDMSDPYLKRNKGENRSHYYCFQDTDDGIYWMIPLSSQIEKYKKIMQKRENAGKTCDFMLTSEHVVKEVVKGKRERLWEC